MSGENDFVRYNVWHYVRSLHNDTCIQFQAFNTFNINSIWAKEIRWSLSILMCNVRRKWFRAL